MTRRVKRALAPLAVSTLSLLLALPGAPAEARGQPDSPAQPQIEDLGGQRYRVGAIIIDKNTGRFEVPAEVLRTEPPLEFLAVARDGRKGYEAMLELDATAYEFNLACILIGLDDASARRAEWHFDPEPVEGGRVALTVRWGEGASEVSLPAQALLLDGGEAVSDSEWSYTGSVLTDDGRYLAHEDGTLIGLVHDPSSVIEHRAGLGIGSYGDLRGAPAAPPAGSRIVLTVSRVTQPPAAPSADAPAEEPPDQASSSLGASATGAD